MENFEEANDDLQTALKFAEEIKDGALVTQINIDLRRMEMAQRVKDRIQSKDSGRK